MEPPKKLIKLNGTQADTSITSVTSEITQFCLDLPPNFQPTGISYNQGDGKTILIITGVNEILTFVLGDLKTILTSAGPIAPLKKNVIEIESEVIKVVHTKVRTYCLHEDRTLSLFTSYKQLKKLKSSIGCRDIIKFKDGVAILVKKPNKNIIIEHLPDISRNSEGQKPMDLGPGVDNERYSLGSVNVTEQNGAFLNKFLGVNVDHRTKKDPLLMFAVGNNIFWVDAPGDSYEIRVVRSCSSKVMKFWFTKPLPMFVVVLVSGVMEVSFWCPVLSLFTCKTFHLFESCWSLNVAKTFVFSDGMNLNVVDLKKGKNEVEMQRKSIQLPGVVGLVHVKELNRTFCVTENRCLYQVVAKVDDTAKSSRQFLLVDDQLLIKAKSCQKQFRQLFEHYQDSHRSTEECKSKLTLLENYRPRSPSAISLEETYLESMPQELKRYRHLLTRLSFDQGHLFVVLEMSNDDLKSCPRIEDTFIMFEYLKVDQRDGDKSKIKRFVRLGDLLSESVQREDTFKLLFVIGQGDHLHLPEMDVSITHLIRKNKDLLMLKSTVRVEITEIKPKLVDEASVRPQFRPKSLVKQILESQYNFGCFLNDAKEDGPLEPISYRFKIPNLNKNHELLTSLLGTTPKSTFTILGRYITIEREQHEDTTTVLTLTSQDIGVLQHLKKLIARFIFGTKDGKSQRWGIGSESLKSLEELSSALTDPTVKECDVMECYQKMREVPMEYT